MNRNVTAKKVKESASSGGTSAGAVATVGSALSTTQRRVPKENTVKVPVTQKPRQGPLRPQTGAGAHRDKKKEQKQGKEKHRKPVSNIDETQNAADIKEIDYSSELGNLSISDKDLISSSTVDGTIGSRDVYVFRKGNEKIYFFVDNSKVDALVYLMGNRAMAMKNFSQNSGLIYNLFQYIVNIKQKKVQLNPQDKLTPDGIKWIVKQINRSSGLKITNSKGQPIDSTALYKEWEKARVTGEHGSTDIVISESKNSKYLRENESRLMPMDIFGATSRIYKSNNVNSMSELTERITVTKKDITEKSGISKSKETEFHARLDRLVHDTFGKRKSEMENRNHSDHEISMASNELISIIEDAMRLLKLVRRYSEMQGLEAWQQSKITKAADYLNSVLNSIQGDAVLNQEDHSNFNNGWGQNSYDTYAGGNHGRGVAESFKGGIVGAGIGAAFTRNLKGAVSGYQLGSAVQDLRNKQENYNSNTQENKYSNLNRELGHERNNLAVKINGKLWKVLPGRGNADSPEEGLYLRKMQQWAAKKSAESGKTWTISLTAADPTYESIKNQYLEQLAKSISEKLDPNADPEVWVRDFLKADPKKYPQFRNKSREKKTQMAIAARYAAKQPKKR